MGLKAYQHAQCGNEGDDLERTPEPEDESDDHVEWLKTWVEATIAHEFCL